MTLKNLLNYVNFDFDIIEENGQELIHLINNRQNAPTLPKDGWPYTNESVSDIIATIKPYWKEIKDPTFLYFFVYPERINLEK